MKFPRRRFLRLIAAATVLPAAPRFAWAQSYPTRPVRWIVSFSAGGGNDTVARLVGRFLSEKLGQQFIIENKAGAGGNIGMAAVLGAPPDGYTIGYVAPNNAINASLYEKLRSISFATACRSAERYCCRTFWWCIRRCLQTVAQFIAYLKANPEKVSFPSAGTGASPHMSAELFMAMTGTKMAHVPYRGGGPAMNDLLPGRVQAMFDYVSNSIEHIKAGQLRALGVTAAKRSAALPDLPTIGETVPDYEVSVWNGIVAPKGTSPEIVAKLNQAVNAVLADPRLSRRFNEMGGAAMPMTPTEFGKLIADETEKWAKVVKFAGIRPD
jgi:tripartite-type tricarboxylate transporter receptor subunit TctC